MDTAAIHPRQRERSAPRVVKRSFQLPKPVRTALVYITLWIAFIWAVFPF